MKRIFNLTFIAVVALTACTSTTPKNNTEEVETQVKENTKGMDTAVFISIEKEGIKLTTAPSQVEYPKAELRLISPKEKMIHSDTVTFNFEVLDYQLQEQTDGTKREILANSEKGQHIHFILNNSPYQAKYDPSFKAELLEGNNVVLAFLSKSFHESVKTKTAFFFENFYIGEGESFFDKSGEHLFYSRPKGVYKKSKAGKILLDFYLLNTTLSETGNRVRVTIDDIEFILTSWSAYFVEGLTVGKHNFRIQLIDKEGNTVEGPFNDSGVRTIEIQEG